MKLSDDMKDKVLAWMGTGRVGSSSKAMAMAVCDMPNNGDHPWDPADLNRCLLFLKAVPEARQHMHKVAALSPVWKQLVDHWEEIEASFLDEVGLDWCKTTSAPNTYLLMKDVIG